MVHYGFSPDEAGLRAFTTAFHDLRKQGTAKGMIANASREGWTVVLKHAFGVELLPEETLSVEQARQLTSMISLRMQSNDFYAKVDTAMVQQAEGLH
jgi:hypothetical protein